MKKYIVNPLSITYEQIRDDIRLMVSSNQNTFSDFFNDGSGSTVIDVASALGAFFAYNVITQRKEFSLEHATSYKSLIGNAYDKGYNVSRGNNIRVKITVNPRISGRLQKWNVLGSYGTYDVTLAHDIIFNENQQTSFEVIIGDRASESIIVTTKELTVFRFTSDDVTDDLRLFLNNTELDYSTTLSDLLNNKYLVMSNSYGSVNVFYLQKGHNPYNPNDLITIDYIKRNTLGKDDISTNEFILNNFDVIGIESISDRLDIESKDSIRINASLHAETSDIIRSRNDFKKVIAKGMNIKSVADEDIQPGRINLYILKKDMQPLTDGDKEIFEKTISEKVVSGVATVSYIDAKKYKNTLNVVLTTQEDEITSANLVKDVLANIESYEYSIGDEINFDDIENYIETQSGVKVARISLDLNKWTKGNYRVSDTCISSNFDNSSYYVSDFNLLTGSVEPTWNTDIIIDNDIIWKINNNLKADSVKPWKSNIHVKIGELISVKNDNNNLVYECAGYNHRTGTNPPNLNSTKIGDYVVDNNIVWERIEPSNNAKTYESNNIQAVGDTVVYNTDTTTAEKYTDTNAHIKYAEFSDDIFGTFYTSDFDGTKLNQNANIYSNSELTQQIGTVTGIQNNMFVEITSVRLSVASDTTPVSGYSNTYRVFISFPQVSSNLTLYAYGKSSSTVDTSVLYSDLNLVNVAAIQVGYAYEKTWKFKYHGFSFNSSVDYWNYRLTSQDFYMKEEINLDLPCYSDNTFDDSKLLGKVTYLDKDNKEVKIGETDYPIYYLRAIDYAMPTGENEPDWSSLDDTNSLLDGKLIWKKSNYPTRKIVLENNTFAEFKKNVRLV